MNLINNLIPAFPFLGFIILALTGKFMNRKTVSFIGVGSVTISAILTLITGINYINHPPESGAYSSFVWNWLNTAGFQANIAFHWDSLSIVFCFVITLIGALIHLYSVGFMAEDEGFTRFFTYMNLFVGSMLILVLADNLLLLYLGWEGVGLCSYLLIGFWYKEPANGYAARKAFIVTRVGDTAMIIGLFILYLHFGTLNISELMSGVKASWPAGSSLPVITALLLLGGAVGKSAQLPLQTWLPDAMAGPSPVSALIHAATMVTAGVYLIARTHVLFILAPPVQTLVAIVGAATLLLAGFSALNQHDLKRILAYSTISQIGYMFLALGVGAWSAAIFHFMIHAFFKALLFLSGGVVILLLNEEHDIFKMGGLAKKMPLVFWTFLAGSASLAALPLITAGFYSKDEILWFAWSASNGSKWLWLAGFAGAFLTSLYTFRLIFVVFFGETKTEPSRKAGPLMSIPLVILAVLSVIGGFIELPGDFGHLELFSGFTRNFLPGTVISNESVPEWVFQVLSALISLGGIYLAYFFYLKKPESAYYLKNSILSKFFEKGWGFDWLYDQVFVKPLVWLSEINKNDFIDLVYNGLASVTGKLHVLFSKSQTGKLRWYITVLAIGIVLMLGVMIFL